MQELQAIFDVIGTPEWACIDAVDNPAWRHYLARLPAQAPHLMRNFGFSGEPAVDFLRRMLAFDPSRRCSAPEAAAHEYLAGASVLSPAPSGLHNLDDIHHLESPSEALSAMDCENHFPSAGGLQCMGDGQELRPSKTWLRLLDVAEGCSGNSQDLDAKAKYDAVDAAGELSTCSGVIS